jgi:sodium/proline symporter
VETPLTITVSFVVYTLGIVLLGLYSAKFASRSTADYLLARKGLGSWVTAISTSASSESGWVTLGKRYFMSHTQKNFKGAFSYKRGLS